VTDAIRAAMDAGMAAQLADLKRRLASGVPRLGWKVGFNDAAVQRKLGVDGFLLAPLDGARRLPGAARAPFRRAASRASKRKSRCAWRVALDGNATPEQALAAVAALAPAIEVVDYARPSDGLTAILTHAIFHFASVIGEERAPDVFATLAQDVPVLTKNGAVERSTDPALRIQDLGALVARGSGDSFRLRARASRGRLDPHRHVG
jgi:2-keto-4-pentenoate hydratase